MRVAVGAAIGGVLGLMTAGPLGATIGATLAGGIVRATSPRRGTMTPKRELVFNRAVETLKDPNELESLAFAFGAEGLEVEAERLRKRAALPSLPKEIARARQEAFRKAMASSDVDAIRIVARAFLEEGASAAAKALSDRADALSAEKGKSRA